MNSRAERALASAGPGTDAAPPGPDSADLRLLELLTLEQIELDLFRAAAASAEPVGLFGGQVAAQALLAAARTEPDGRHPHSLHGYFLSRGDASHPVLLTVHRDRDGGSFSNRRVIAVQRGTVIFNLAASFHVTEPGSDHQANAAPPVSPPDDLADNVIRHPLRGVDVRIPEQPDPGQQ